MYCYGGLLGAQGTITNGDFYILDLETYKWEHKSLASYKTIIESAPDINNPKKNVDVEK